MLFIAFAIVVVSILLVIVIKDIKNSHARQKSFSKSEKTSTGNQISLQKQQATTTKPITSSTSLPVSNVANQQAATVVSRSSSTNSGSGQSASKSFEYPAHTSSMSIKNSAEPSNVVKAVLLTSSGKGGGACVAAYDLSSNKFVRFVSDAKTAAEISFNELHGINIFDIVQVENLMSCPIGPQSENILIRRYGIKRIGKYDGDIESIRAQITYPDACSLADTTACRLLSVQDFNHSLEIINVQNLELVKTQKYNGSYTTRANFYHKGRYYTDFRVTDFNYDLRKKDYSRQTFSSADLILSIPKSPFIISNGENLGYYKFVAAIFPLSD